ncbi:hypothetical protein [Streptomyces triticiradicis]|uniref:Uncharacterized protein n=1 Tax=Streptomyces triticiradicis TaxID=2651189 RepID=A0A7J5DJA7_9ACTN|nr:hypothetical protein [Streptomyces triticiradicis]KAB1988690.1 hypothetical protein F8144_11530 [Streptomyces triticiradicis]
MVLVSDQQPEETNEPTVPDDVWERFARDSERDIRASAPKEPSARARMVTERLRLQDEREAEQAARRGFRKKEARSAAGPEGWRTNPARRAAEGRAARRRKLWAVLGVPLAVVVAVVAMKPSLLPGGLFDRSGGSASAGPELPAETATPTAPPSAQASQKPTRERPFAGSPAERWADGADAIVVPKATRVGVLTKDQVATALRGTKDLLVGANLDPATLRGERPAAAIAVLDPKQPHMIDGVDRKLRAPDEKHDPLTLFSRFDPREVHLVGNVVKTRGRITFEAGKDGSVAIHADYTFVYPVSSAKGNADEVTRTIVRRVLDVDFLNPRKFRVTPGKVTVRRYDQEIGNSACYVHDGFLHPLFDSTAPTSASPTGPAVDPYDRSRDLRDSPTGDCGTLSRT